MPLAPEQRRLMQVYLRSNTIYRGIMLAISPEAPSQTCCFQHIMDGIERALDSEAPSFHCDLFLPNCFITKRDRNDFWLGMARIIADGSVPDWHAMEYGAPLNSADKRERYVYSWSYQNGSTIKFYTKVLNDGYNPELVWYIGKFVMHSNMQGFCENVDGNESESTETDEISLHTF
jgi:hypothetical protein